MLGIESQDIQRRIDVAVRAAVKVTLDPWMNAAEAAAHARLNKDSFLRLRRRGEAPAGVGSGKLLRWRRSTIDKWLEGNRHAA